MKHAKQIAVVGAGLAGVVLARQLAEQGGIRVIVVESQKDVGGNCATERDLSRGPGGNAWIGMCVDSAAVSVTLSVTATQVHGDTRQDLDTPVNPSPLA